MKEELLVEVFYTKNINITRLISKGKARMTEVEIFGQGHSTKGGKPKNPLCEICNLNYIFSSLNFLRATDIDVIRLTQQYKDAIRDTMKSKSRRKGVQKQTNEPRSTSTQRNSSINKYGNSFQLIQPNIKSTEDTPQKDSHGINVLKPIVTPSAAMNINHILYSRRNYLKTNSVATNISTEQPIIVNNNLNLNKICSVSAQKISAYNKYVNTSQSSQPFLIPNESSQKKIYRVCNVPNPIVTSTETTNINGISYSSGNNINTNSIEETQVDIIISADKSISVINTLEANKPRSASPQRISANYKYERFSQPIKRNTISTESSQNRYESYIVPNPIETTPTASHNNGIMYSNNDLHSYKFRNLKPSSRVNQPKKKKVPTATLR